MQKKIDIQPLRDEEDKLMSFDFEIFGQQKNEEDDSLYQGRSLLENYF